MQERTTLVQKIEGVLAYEKRLEEAILLVEMGTAEADQDTIQDGESELGALQKDVNTAVLESLLSEEADGCSAFLEIHAGAGGTEAQDWAEMLSRMYLRWCERRGYKAELMQEVPGEEAGIKSITFQIKGDKAYGWLKTESGVHRLVRISPFDANAKRHTSFASVWVYPVIDDTITIDIQDKDIRVDTYRASGAGGQHVNKTDSAIRITHMPTGIVVQCQNDRSQHRNRAQAFDMLRARIYEHELQKKQQAAQAQADSKTAIGWGHQIRSYVLHPYQMVKDLRTSVEKEMPKVY